MTTKELQNQIIQTLENHFIYTKQRDRIVPKLMEAIDEYCPKKKLTEEEKARQELLKKIPF